MSNTGQSQHIKKYGKGTIIVREGDTGNEMYILIDGNAGVYKNYQEPNELLMATLGPGNFFGEMSLFLDKNRTATVVALSEVTAVAVVQKNALDVFANQLDIVYSMMGELCKRIDTMNTNYQELHGKLYGGSASAQTPSKRCSLFPESHGEYTLPTFSATSDYLYIQNSICPLCGCEFESLTVIVTKLRRAGTERDLRVRYIDAEPMYYDIVSCPKCLYSAPTDPFPTASQKLSGRIDQELSKYKLDVEIKTGRERDAFTVFAGYYLALICAPLCFDEHQMITASLWKKLANLYRDCGDNAMFLYASENALREYEHVYGHFDLSEARLQQVCYMIGDLHERLKDYDKARTFFFMAKSNRMGTKVMQVEADKRLEEIKQLISGR